MKQFADENEATDGAALAGEYFGGRDKNAI